MFKKITKFILELFALSNHLQPLLPTESVKLTEAIRNTGKTYEDIGQFFAQQPSKDLVPFEDFLREYHGMILTFPDMIQFHKVRMFLFYNVAGPALNLQTLKASCSFDLFLK